MLRTILTTMTQVTTETIDHRYNISNVLDITPKNKNTLLKKLANRFKIIIKKSCIR